MSNPLACPRCGYERKASDQGPLSKCLSCKVVFSRYKRAEEASAPEMTPFRWTLFTLTGLLSVHSLLICAGLVLFYAATPVAMASVLLGGLPSLIFLLLHFLIPLLSFLGGLAAWRSVIMALVIGLPILPLSTAVLTLASSGEKYMAVPVPWPAAVALGSVGSTVEMLKVEAIPYWPAFVTGLAFGLLMRLIAHALALRRQRPNPSIERDVQGLAPLAAPHVKR
jgi:hypothetical protein